MKSLFLRIFLSFWFAMGLTVISGSALTAFIAWNRFGYLQNIDGSGIAHSAARSLAQGGLPALRVWLKNQQHENPLIATYIVDMHGADILGRPLTEPIQTKVQRMRSLGYLYVDDHPPPPMPDPMQFNPQIVGADGTLYTFFWSYTGTSAFGILSDASVSVSVLFVALGVSALACWWLARRLILPLSRLQASARALAEGDLTVRFADEITQRQDEVGVLARDFDQMADRVRSLLTSKEALLRYVSHELRSPLARLRVALTLARRGTDNAREMDRIERETERLDALIGQILRLSRLQSAESNIERQSIDLNHLVSDVVDDARMEGCPDRKNVSWQPAAPVTVLGNADALRSAIENVLRNAVRFTEPDTEVEVHMSIAGGHVVLTVRDHGPGVPPAELEQIFEPFYRVAETADRGSMGGGLGLAITGRIINLHNGTVQARNAPGGGLIVAITLPLIAEPAAASMQ